MSNETMKAAFKQWAALTDQQIYDKFYFLEGLVSERTYRQIADTAIEIARAASPQSEQVKPEARLVTFDEFVQYGLDHGANVVKGMPWSFIFNGHAVTHENDDLYLIGTPSIPFRRGEVLVATAFGDSRLIQVLQPPARAAAPQSGEKGAIPKLKPRKIHWDDDEEAAPQAALSEEQREAVRWAIDFADIRDLDDYSAALRAILKQGG